MAIFTVSFACFFDTFINKLEPYTPDIRLFFKDNRPKGGYKVIETSYLVEGNELGIAKQLNQN